jgi:hypothetical protein
LLTILGLMVQLLKGYGNNINVDIVVSASLQHAHATRDITAVQPCVILQERLPTPFGLVRTGVAPDHEDTKASMPTGCQACQLVVASSSFCVLIAICSLLYAERHQTVQSHCSRPPSVLFRQRECGD